MNNPTFKRNLLYFLLGLSIIALAFFSLKEAIHDGQETKRQTEKERRHE